MTKALWIVVGVNAFVVNTTTAAAATAATIVE
jgi:hypothetical protein